MAGNANGNSKGATSTSHMRLVASSDLETSEDEFEILKSAAATVAGGPRPRAMPNSQESGDHELEDDDENEEEDMEEDEDDDDIASLSDLERHAEEYDDGHLWSVLADACTLEESQSYRQLLRDAGPVEFIRMTIENDSITAKKLLTAFGVRPPAVLEGQPDESYYGVLSVAMSRELSKRVKLKHFNTVDDAVMLISHARNIIVLTGAGISTSLGIPDFRSKGGLYSKLEHLNLNDPQEVFDITLFKEDPSIFYTIARDILPSGDKFTPTHKFIYLLQQKGKLLTNYSQNIDNIEAIAGILPEKLIQCHGSFATASCVQCHYKVPLDPQSSLYKTIKAGEIPKCEECTKKRLLLKAPVMKRKRSQNGQDKKRKKFDRDADSSEDEAYDHPSIGVMKPDITFFGEALPDTFSDRLTKHDKHKVDLVIVIGTSLKVAPVSEVIPYLPPGIPQMYISREPVAHVNFDIDLLGDCDIVVAELCRRLGWDLDHEMVPPGQVVNIELAPDTVSRHLFTEQKPEQ